MDFAAQIRQEIEESIACKREVLSRLPAGIETAARWVAEAIGAGGKLLLFGNGGSAADAQHLAAELVGRYLAERQGLAALALTTDTSCLTGVGNDYGFERVFARQLEALGRPGDVAVALSTSGDSSNVLAGIRQAKAQQIRVIGLLGRDGGKAAGEVDLALVVPGPTARVQEAHILIGHIICRIAEELLLSRSEQ